jgi:hypothetical protein
VRDIVQDIKNRGESDGDCLAKSAFEKVWWNIDYRTDYIILGTLAVPSPDWGRCLQDIQDQQTAW